MICTRPRLAAPTPVCAVQDLRADRQLEFTQMDLEMAFADTDVIMGLMERLVSAIFLQVGFRGIGL